MAYNTGNPIGSKDPRDLSDNAENLDTAVNTTSDHTWTDRLGNTRKTWLAVEESAPIATAAADRADSAADRAEQEADRAEAAAGASEAAAIASALALAAYDTIDDGRAAVSDGQTFWVKPNETDGLTRYTNFLRTSASTQEFVADIAVGAEVDAVREVQSRNTLALGEVYADLEILTQGDTTPDSATLPATYAYGPKDPIPYSGYLEEISFRMSASGVAKVWLFDNDEDRTVLAELSVSHAGGVIAVPGKALYAGEVQAGMRVMVGGASGGNVRFATGGTILGATLSSLSQTVGQPSNGTWEDNYWNSVAVAVSIKTIQEEDVDTRLKALEALPSKELLEVQLGESFSDMQQVTAGSTGYGTTARAPTNWIFAARDPLHSAAQFTKLRVKISPTGGTPGNTYTGSALVVGLNQEGTAYVVKRKIDLSYTLPDAVAVVEFDLTPYLLTGDPGDYLFWQSDTDYGVPIYINGGSQGAVARGRTYKVGDTLVDANFDYGNSIAIEYEATAGLTLGPRVAALENAIASMSGDGTPKHSTIMVQEVFHGSTLPTGWTFSGTWAVDNNGLLPPADGGWNRYAIVDHHTSIARRKMRAEFVVGAATDVFGVCTKPPENSGGAAFIVDGANEQMLVYAWSGGGSPGSASTPVPIPELVPGRRYVLEVYKHDLSCTCTLIDTVTQQRTTLEDPQSSAYRTWHGQFGVIVLAGQPRVRWARMDGLYPRDVQCIFIGDSNQEVNYLLSGPISAAFQLAKLRGAEGDFIVAARAGDETPNFLSRMHFDVEIWHPQKVVIALGTNDTNQTTWRTNMQTIIDAVLAVGGEPILATQVPRTASQALRDAMNADIKGRYFGPYRYINFASAVSDGHDEQTWNSGYDYGDHTHVNVVGQAAMLAQCLVDIPDIV